MISIESQPASIGRLGNKLKPFSNEKDFDVVFVNSVRFEPIDCSCHFLVFNYRKLNLNFLKSEQLFVSGVIELNPGLAQNHCKSPHCRLKKIKAFKGTPEKCDLNEKISVSVVRDPKVQNVFFSQIPPVSLNLIEPCQLVVLAL